MGIHRLIVGIGLFLLVGCSPKDQEDCKARAAKDANSAAALNVLIASCERDFPAIRRDDGTYAYYDTELSEWVGVSGPTLSDADLAVIREKRSERRAATIKAAKDKDDTLSNLKVISYDITCNMNDNYSKCYNKNITLKIKNDSLKSVYGVSISYEIGDEIDCSGSLGKEFYNNITIPPGGIGSIVHNVMFEDAGPDGVMNGCVQVSDVGAVSGQPVPKEILP
jgi:hypothetical protein